MDKNLKIKVCGMRDTENIQAVAQLDIDFMGFIFYPKSPRFVKMISSEAGIIPDYSEERLRKQQGKEVKAENRRTIARVGVFVDEMPQSIITRVYNYSLDYIQLHGSESPTMIDNLRRTLVPDIAPHVKIIKALSIGTAQDVLRYREYEGAVDLFLFDTRCPTVGGSGSKFSWSVLESYDGATPFLLSGGIGPDDADRVRDFCHPKCIGIDVNSRFETAPGVKDVQRLRTFINQVRQ